MQATWLHQQGIRTATPEQVQTSLEALRHNFEGFSEHLHLRGWDPSNVTMLAGDTRLRYDR